MIDEILAQVQICNISIVTWQFCFSFYLLLFHFVILICDFSYLETSRLLEKK